MGIVIQRSGYASLVTYIGMALGYINMLLLLPYALRPDEVGLVRLLISVATLFATFFSFGGNQIATRYFPYYSGTIRRRGLFVSSLFRLVVFGTILFAVCLSLFRETVISVYADKSPLFISFVWCLLPITGSLILYGFFEALVIVQGQVIVPTVIREVYTRLILTIAGGAILFALISLKQFVYLISLLYCIGPAVLLYYGMRRSFFPIKESGDRLARTEMKNLAEFGGFMFLGNVAGSLLANVDGIILSAYAGLASTGIYSIALFIAVIIEVPKRALSQVLIPMIVVANKEDDRKTLDTLYKKSSLNEFIVGATIFLVIWMNIDNIFLLIPKGAVYAQGKYVVLFVSLAKLFDMLTGVNAEIIGTSRYYKKDLLIYFTVSLVGIGLNFLLIPTYGVNGAAIAALVSVVLYNIVRFAFIALAMRIQPFTVKTVFALISFAATYLLVTLLPPLHGAIVDILLRTMVICLLFGSMIIGFRVSEDVSGTFFKAVQRVKSLT